MSNVNSVVLSGNLTKDPELRHTAGGTAVCNLRLASNRSRKTDDGYTDETTFIDVVVWSGFGELVNRKLSKGDSVTISGRLQSREWEQDDGQKRSKIELVADQLDSAAMFNKDDATREAPSTQPAEAPQQTTIPADDDIPF